MLITRPLRALSIGRVHALRAQKAPNRFVSRTSVQSSAFIRMIRSSRVMPALLTRMSILPKASSTAFTSVSAPCCSLASAWTASERRPSDSTSATVAAAASVLPR